MPPPHVLSKQGQCHGPVLGTRLCPPWQLVLPVTQSLVTVDREREGGAGCTGVLQPRPTQDACVFLPSPHLKHLQHGKHGSASVRPGNDS